MPHPQARLVFSAGIQYQRRQWRQARRTLRKVVAPECLGLKQLIEAKARLRLSMPTPDQTSPRWWPGQLELYRDYLFDTASLIAISGDPAEARRRYRLFLEQEAVPEEKERRSLAFWQILIMTMRLEEHEALAALVEEGLSLYPTWGASLALLRFRMEQTSDPSLFESDLHSYGAAMFQKQTGRDLIESGQRRFLVLFGSPPSPWVRPLWDRALWLYEQGWGKTALLILNQAADNSPLTSPSDRAWLALTRSILALRCQSPYHAFRAWQDIPGNAAILPPPPFHQILFPLPFRDEIWKAAEREHLDPFLVCSLIRQESFFRPSIGSSAGAIGLMQMMPATARLLNKELRLDHPERKLTTPAINLRLGCRYLRKLLDRYNGSVEHALAAYNAGESRVDNWQLDLSNEPEWFTEQIPFSETRTYVKTILRNYFYYRRFYDSESSLPAPDGVFSGSPPVPGP